MCIQDLFYYTWLILEKEKQTKKREIGKDKFKWNGSTEYEIEKWNKLDKRS